MANIDYDRRVFDTAFALWSSRSHILETRRRLKRFTYGDQWSDPVTDNSGKRVTEGELYRQIGRKPLTNNLIRRLVKTIVGRYRDMASRNLWYDKDSERPNLLEETDSRLLEEFLISGMAIQRVADDNPFREGEAHVANVSPENFFCNDFRDHRGYDIEFAGMLHDMSPAEVVSRFGKKDRTKIRRLEKILNETINFDYPCSVTSGAFFTPMAGRCRVIECWTRQFDHGGNIRWQSRWFSASGQLLDSYPSPWAHGGHPFALKFYPLIDGEIHSFVEDLIDQQKYINRIIVLIDKILSTSAKGVLLFPKDQLTDDMDWQKIADQWARPDGIIPLKGSTSLMPVQVGGNASDSNAYKLLEMELRLFEQTSGVGSALMGTPATGATQGVEHYRELVENATVALNDTLLTFRSLINLRDTKIKNLK